MSQSLRDGPHSSLVEAFLLKAVEKLLALQVTHLFEQLNQSCFLTIHICIYYQLYIGTHVLLRNVHLFRKVKHNSFEICKWFLIQSVIKNAFIDVIYIVFRPQSNLLLKYRVDSREFKFIKVFEFDAHKNNYIQHNNVLLST